MPSPKPSATLKSTTLERSRLHPHYVFTVAMTQLNQFYWTSKYALERVPAILAAISTTSSVNDPVVSALWPTEHVHMKRNTSVPLSTYFQHAVATIDSARAVAILGACSAFENALVNYYILGALYYPEKVLTGWNYASVPKVLRHGTAYERLKRKAVERAGEVLKAGYGARMRILLDAFGVDRSTLHIPVDLEKYYNYRHLVAHNQGIADDYPWLPPNVILESRVTIAEDEWRQMLRVFNGLLTSVDELMQTVIPLRGVHLAVHWAMESAKTPSQKLGSVRYRANMSWHLHESHGTIQQAAVECGYRVSTERRYLSRSVSRK